MSQVPPGTCPSVSRLLAAPRPSNGTERVEASTQCRFFVQSSLASHGIRAEGGSGSVKRACSVRWLIVLSGPGASRGWELLWASDPSRKFLRAKLGSRFFVVQRLAAVFALGMAAENPPELVMQSLLAFAARVMGVVLVLCWTTSRPIFFRQSTSAP
jgi:hypothetical protein